MHLDHGEAKAEQVGIALISFPSFVSMLSTISPPSGRSKSRHQNQWNRCAIGSKKKGEAAGSSGPAS
jgi:hypothetical protein